MRGGVIDLKKPLAPDSPGREAFLGSIQAGILKPHGRHNAAYVFLNFSDPVAGRKLLAGLAGESSDFAERGGAAAVVSALGQAEASERWKAARQRALGDQTPLSDPVRSVALSSKGYDALAIERALRPVGAAFEQGMHARIGALGDEPWRGYLADVHSCVVIADDDAARLHRQVEALIAAARDHDAELRGVEVGAMVFSGSSAMPVEHFGWHDGISQPRMVLEDWQRERRERGARHWTALAALDLAFVGDSPDAGPNRYGSFVAFRKLEQHIYGKNSSFYNKLQDLSQLLDDPTMARAGAMAMGRFREDGAPRSYHFGFPAEPEAFINDFNFTEDPGGDPCPFFAHIRKANPRDAISDYDPDDPVYGYTAENGIVRRGITYDHGDRGKGLLFASCQSDLARFERIQIALNRSDDPAAGTGVDAVVGWTDAAPPVAQVWPDIRPVPFAMHNFVTLEGGEYFYMPSVPFLLQLPTLPVER